MRTFCLGILICLLSLPALSHALKAEGRFTDRNIAFEEVADPRFAIEVAKELGYKVP